MAIETLGVRNIHAAQDQLAPLDKGVNVVADSNVDHD
jgi:hypothetical protein